MSYESFKKVLSETPDSEKMAFINKYIYENRGQYWSCSYRIAELMHDLRQLKLLPKGCY